MDYQMIKLNTVWNKEPKLGGISIVEGEKDIPFAIKRIYCLYKTEENRLGEFYAKEKGSRLLFCPYGVVDIMLTDGKEQATVTLDSAEKGLLVGSELRCEISWKEEASVLCVAVDDDDRMDGSSLIPENGEMEPGDVRGVKMLKFPLMPITTVVDIAPRSVMIRGLQDVPFEIKRFFFIFGSGNIGLIRGKHANRKSEFVLFNISGKSKVKVIDEDRSETVYELNDPQDAVYLPRMIWKEMYDFGPDSVLMVVTNEYYDSTEYMRDFDLFAEEIREKKKNWKA